MKEALGLSSLYNTSLGTVSAMHLYDRVEEAGRLPTRAQTVGSETHPVRKMRVPRWNKPVAELTNWHYHYVFVSLSWGCSCFRARRLFCCWQWEAGRHGELILIPPA